MWLVGKQAAARKVDRQEGEEVLRRVVKEDSYFVKKNIAWNRVAN